MFFPLIKTILEPKGSDILESQEMGFPAHFVEVQSKEELPANKEDERFFLTGHF